MRRRLTLAVVMLALGLACAPAFANTLTFTLNNPVQLGKPGTTFTYSATVSAPLTNTGAEFLNGDSFNVTAPLTLDDADFFANYPFFLNPGQSFTGALFTISDPPSTPPGIYSGTFTLLGGLDGGAGNPIGTVSFSTNVTPEPSSLLLLGTGMIAAFTTLRRRRPYAV